MNIPRRRPDPILMGEPSPGLARINRMNIAQLAERIDRLKAEAAILAKKIERLKAQDPLPQAEINTVTVQVARLRALEKAARERMDGKSQRRDRRSPSPRSPRR